MSGPPVENWRLFTGPVGWYRLWHPPQWTVQESRGAHTLFPSDGEALLSVRALWVTPPDSQQPEHLWEPASHVRRQRAVDESGLPQCVGSRAGEAALQQPAPWWKRPFSRTEWRSWQTWIFRKGPVVVAATLVHGPVTDPELTSLCRMILSSLELPDSPADPPDVFARRVFDLARRRFPLLECRLADGLQITIGESTLNLFNFYRSYIRAPERFEEILLPALSTVVRVQEWGESQTRPPLDTVRGRIMPMLYPETIWQEKFARFVGSSWVAGLAVLYVVDESQAYWYIPEELLQLWELSPQELHDLSVENLERYFEQNPMELAVAGSETGEAALLMPGRSDAYNAARLVSPDFTARLREVIGGDLAVGLPGRDFFVAVSLKSQEMIEHVRGRVHEDFANMDHPLTDRLLLVTADGVCEYFDPEKR